MLDEAEYNELVGLLEAIYKVDCYNVRDIIQSQILLRGASEEQVREAYLEAGVEPEEGI